MKFTDEQQNTIDDCLSWIRSGYNPNKIDYKIVGWAGTGKSTVINHIIDSANIRIAVCAPTHKALRVLKNMGSVTTYTVHSALGLRLNTNIEYFNIQKPNFEHLNKSKFGEFSVMIFDEASMIPKKLYNFIINLAKKTFTKIIFVGDPLQLPPVGESISSALKERDYNFSKLTKIVRQEEGHPVLELLSMIRDDILNDTKTFITHLVKNKDRRSGNIGYKVYTPAAFKQKLKEVFSQSEYNNNVNHVKYLAFTNKRIHSINNVIRSFIIPNYKEAVITTDDLITSYNTIVEKEFLNKLIVNSDDYVPINITKHTSVTGYNGFIVVLKNIYNRKQTSMFILDHSDKNTMQSYIMRLSKLHEVAYADKSKWRNYYSFKDANICMTKFTIFNRHYPKGISVDRDLDYAYGSTVHKSQGSTYINAFVDINDINQAAFIQNRLFRNRLLYVAMSRIQKAAYIIL